MMPFLNSHNLLDAIATASDNGSVMLTPNQRLAATLIKQHQQLQIKQGKLCWPTPKIIPFSTWLESVWFENTKNESSLSPLLLTSAQEKILWEEIIKKSPESCHLLQISRTAKLVMSAWELLKQWKIDPHHPELTLTEESKLFQTWAKQFQIQCVKKKWLDHNSLADSICLSIQQKKITLPQKINLIGFIETSPQMQNLLDAYQKQGVKISTLENFHFENSMQDKKIFRVPLNNRENEIITMARWAKTLYDKNIFSDIKIGCIVPDLENCRDEMERVFREILTAESLFNISAGKTLISYPVIYTALEILNLSATSISIEKLSHLLRSPFIGDGEKEGEKRALLDNYLRSFNISTFTLSNLTKLNFSTTCPLLEKRLQEYLNHFSNTQKKLTPSQWASFFSDALLILGWPGERSLNSQEFQVIQNCWLPLLNEFAKLDIIFSSLNQQQALYYLTQLTEQTIFQPQSPEAPIQILGTLEAAGLSFDHLWVMGLNDTIWPAPPSPNPFIPLQLQKKLNMPHSSADRELIYSQKITEQFIQSSQDIVMSYSKQQEEVTLRPSALIKNLSLIEENQLVLNHFIPVSHSIFNHQQLEWINDYQAPALSENETIHGGSSIFKLQAACPFKAFAELRLNACYLEAPSIGLRPQDRGKIIHKILELLWSELKESMQLHVLDNHSLSTLLSQCIDKAFNYSYATKNNKKSRYLNIEKIRLNNLLLQWLEQEKKRPAFRVIACEQKRNITLSKINFQLRIDRIDELEQGDKLIIDYKTGKYNQINSWFSTRPDEPQLPLYCATDPDNITSIAFAELHPDSIQFKGISKESLDIAGIKQHETMSWEQQINQWRDVLIKLGDDFYHGIAMVDPKNNEQTCRQCHLQGLCRVYET